MVILEAWFHFRVEGLQARKELLGSRETVNRDGHTIQFVLPRTSDDFGVGSSPDVYDYALKRVGGTVDEPDQVNAISLVRLVVDFDAEISMDDFAKTTADRSKIDALHSRLRELASVARGAFHDYLERVRTDYGQTWLSMSSEAPRLGWLSSVIVAESRERLPFAYNDPIVAVSYGLERALTPEQHRHALAKVEASEAPSLGRTLLADAQHLMHLGESIQYREGLLLTAIACEVRIKEVLRSNVQTGSQGLLDIVLENPRDVSLPVVTLFDKTLKAVVGVSLRESNKELYRGLVHLFEDRNKIAHKGGSGVSDKQMREGVRTASAVFNWLDRIEADLSKSEGRL